MAQVSASYGALRYYCPHNGWPNGYYLQGEGAANDCAGDSTKPFLNDAISKLSKELRVFKGLERQLHILKYIMLGNFPLFNFLLSLHESSSMPSLATMTRTTAVPKA